MKDLSDWKTNSIQKHIPNMSQDGSQTKRKRDATTGSTVKAHLDWRDKYLDKFHTTPHKGIEEFITELLTTQRQEILDEVLKTIGKVKYYKCKDTNSIDYGEMIPCERIDIDELRKAINNLKQK